jgi:hypothetical protein
MHLGRGFPSLLQQATALRQSVLFVGYHDQAASISLYRWRVGSGPIVGGFENRSASFRVAVGSWVAAYCGSGL